MSQERLADHSGHGSRAECALYADPRQRMFESPQYTTIWQFSLVECYRVEPESKGLQSILIREVDSNHGRKMLPACWSGVCPPPTSLRVRLVSGCAIWQPVSPSLYNLPE
jgi:hypothetical protein